MNKQIDIVIGQSYGDEGKAKAIDLLMPNYDVAARFGGGSNAGHTIVLNGKSFVFNQLPSCLLHKDKIAIISNGCVLNIPKLEEEIKNLESLGISVKDRLFISDRAHVVTKSHIEKDINREENHLLKIGSTKQGIGPAYEDKISRVGLTLNELKKINIDSTIKDTKQFWFDLEKMICDTSDLIHKFLKEGKKILCEGAQGTFLDIDHGTYPFVTSSNTIAGAACTGLGISPTLVNKVIGITKAYTTRVGDGPLVTELNTDSGPGKIIAETGKEYGSVTGRPRRIGWLNLVELKKAIQLNGCSEIILTKLDVLSALDEIKICTKYIDNEPFYETFAGWKSDISQAKKWWDLPDEAVSYINFIENQIETKITMISVGPERKQYIKL